MKKIFRAAAIAAALLIFASCAGLAEGPAKAPETPSHGVITLSKPAVFTGSIDIRIQPAEDSDLPSAEPFLTDPKGRSTGPDVIGIPNSSYDLEGVGDELDPTSPPERTGVLSVMNPIPGEYRLKVTGTEDDTYTLEIQTQDALYNPSSASFKDIETAEGQVDEYIIKYGPKGVRTTVEAIKKK
ncbi:MAG TPA: hypothetical protein VGK71_09680 [Nitrospirota bacterium]